MTDRPLLLLDVDGPLNPYGAKPSKRPEGYETHRLAPDGWIGAPLRVWLNPEHGPMLLALAERAGLELAWATTWEHNANDMIGCHIGLPALPVIEFGKSLSGMAWKWGAVAQYATGRPLAWFDDNFQSWEHKRVGFDMARRGIPTLLHTVSPSVGLRLADLDAVEEWAGTL